MDIPQRLALCCVCTASLALAGCAAPYPYQPYPYQQYPGGYYGQPNSMGPSMGTPPGGVQLNAPTPIAPGTPNGGSSNGGSSSGGDAPMWNPDSGASSGAAGSSGSSKNVPLYDDPTGDLGPAPETTQQPELFDDDKNAFDADAPPFGLNDSPTVESPEVRNVAFEEDAKTVAGRSGLELASNESLAEIPRATTPEAVKAPAPLEFTNAAFEQPVERARSSEALNLPYDPAEIPNPFAHDTEAYRFLRGLVTYDDQLQAWSIIYDDKPSRDDEFGGVFTLADHPGLTVLKDNDVVYLEGQVSESLMDEFGKPRYIVKHLSKLKPKAEQ